MTIHLKKINLILCLGISLAYISCEDSIEGDTNIDPLATSSVDPALLFPEILLGGLTSNRTVESFQMSTHSQHWSFIANFGVFRNPETGTIGPNTINNIWNGVFTNALRNLDQIKIITELEKPEATNIIGQAKVLEAFAFLNATLVFGDVPFDQAIQVEQFPSPKFNTQKEVLLGIVDLIDQANIDLEQETEIIGSPGDLVYGGDRLSWIRFGNSIKLKALMLIANREPETVQAKIIEVSKQPLITSNEFEAKLDYNGDAGNQNPIYTLIVQFNSGVNGFYAGGTTLVNLMNQNNDPRRATYFDDVDGQYVGQKQGVFTDDDVSAVSLNIIRPEMPDRYITASEINFLLAEAVLNDWADGDANEFYRAGIQSSLDFYDEEPGEISAADKTTYLDSERGSIAADSKENALLKIHEELYVSNFTRPLESWTDVRRTKVPTLEPIEGTVLTDNIRRYQVPLSEITANPNAPDNKALIIPMWFQNK